MLPNKFLMLTLYCLLGFDQVNAQFKDALIVIDGLTCSMCSLAVERSIDRLEFVHKVKLDLNENLAHVEFNNKDVDITLLVQSVEDAGFSVRNLTIVLFLKASMKDQNDSSLVFNNDTYFLMNGRSHIPEGLIPLRLLNKRFSDKSGYERYKTSIERVLQQRPKSRRYYFVTI